MAIDSVTLLIYLASAAIILVLGALAVARARVGRKAGQKARAGRVDNAAAAVVHDLGLILIDADAQRFKGVVDGHDVDLTMEAGRGGPPDISVAFLRVSSSQQLFPASLKLEHYEAGRERAEAEGSGLARPTGDADFDRRYLVFGDTQEARRIPTGIRRLLCEAHPAPNLDANGLTLFASWHSGKDVVDFVRSSIAFLGELETASRSGVEPGD